MRVLFADPWHETVMEATLFASGHRVSEREITTQPHHS